MTATYNLLPNAIYRRTDLHQRFGGQRQGGISTPASSPVVLVFTGSAGTQHGYSDGLSNGVFCYFGEGQKGDMQWLRGNAAIRDHGKNGRDLLLFEMLSEPRSHVRFLGTYGCGSWEFREAPDTTGAMRRAIVFHLLPITEDDRPADNEPPAVGDLADLRSAAIEAGRDTPSRKTSAALQSYAQRSAAVRRYALARAYGACERCAQNAPFLTSAGAPFLEVHHINRLTDGGPDRIDAVAALCPNCHREAHFGQERATIKAALTEMVAAKELKWQSAA